MNFRKATGFLIEENTGMQKLLGYDDLPADIKNQITNVVDVWKAHQKNNLIGVYLHGSIVLNAFNPSSGDIDILVVVKDSIDASEKLAIAKDIISLDGAPRPVEISAIKLSDAKAWKNPGNCVFHYSDFWRDKYLARFRDPASKVYVVDREFPDGDVTSYIKLIKQSGIVLYGQNIQDVFADISDEDFWEAICSDIDEYDFHAYDPRYFASNILILGRSLSFNKEKLILSKYDGGLWMIQNVPENLKYLPEAAMNIWFNNEDCAFPEDDLEKLRQYLIKEIKA